VEFISFVIISVCFLFFILKNKLFKLNEIPIIYIVLAYILKLLLGITLWYIYTHYYSDKSVNDIYKYFNDGRKLAEIFKNNVSDFVSVLFGEKINSQDNLQLFQEMKFWEKPNSYGFYNDNQTIIIISSILNLISNNNLILSMLYMSILSFTTTFVIYKKLSAYLEWKKAFFILLFLSPSIGLWTTGLLKENLILIALTIIVYFSTELLFKINTLNILGILIGVTALTVSKPYLTGFILPSLICLYFIKYFKIKNIKLIYLTMYFLLFAIFITWTYTHNPVVYNYKNKSEAEKTLEYNRVNQISYKKNVLGNNYNILEMLRFKQADYKHEAKLANAKSLINTKKMNGELSNFFLCIPYGISNGFARPHIFEIYTFSYLLPALENFLIILLFIIILIFPRKLEVDQQNLVFHLGTFVVLTFTFLGLLVPVLGNLVRYKAPLLPLLYFCLLALVDKSKYQSFTSKITRKI
jgi:hypothetical protein